MVQSTTTSRPKRESAVLRLTSRKGETVGYIALDGVTFEVANPSHFGLRQGGMVQRAMNRIVELEAIAEIDPAAVTAEQDAEYRQHLIAVATVALPDAPATVIEKLATGTLSDLAVHFFAVAAMLNPRLAMLAKLAPKQPTGTTSSRSSRGSTAATPGSG